MIHRRTQPESDTPLSMAEAAVSLSAFRGRPVHLSTVRRWASSGLRGIRLETWFVGGRRCTSRAALKRFFEAVTAKRNGAMVAARAAVAEPSGPHDAVRERLRLLHGI